MSRGEDILWNIQFLIFTRYEHQPTEHDKILSYYINLK